MINNTIENSYHGLTNSKMMLIILVYVFVAVTFFTTFNGVVNYIFGSWEEAPALSLVIFGIVLFCLQAYLLLRSTYHIIEFRKNNWVKNGSWFLIWVFTFMFSATFSYTFYYNIFSADAYGEHVIEQQIANVVADADKYRASFKEITQDINTLAKYSNDKAIEEKAKGGTCGDFSPAGPGPRRAYRERERAVFQSQATKVSQLNTQVEKELEQFKQQKKKYVNKTITTIPELQQAFNLSVTRLNTYNDQHPTLQAVAKTLVAHYKGQRKTSGVDKDGMPIFCFDAHIDKSIDNIKSKLAALQAIPNVVLFDRSNHRELQNRVLEVFLSPFRDDTENDFSGYDYIALALGFLVETLMFIITLILHQGNNSYPTNRFGYIGEWFSSYDVVQLQEHLQVDKSELMKVMYSAKKHQLGYMIIREVERDFCPIINALDRKGLFSKKLNAVEFKSLDKNIKKLEHYDDETVVNLYFSPNRLWADYRMSLDHLKEA